MKPKLRWFWLNTTFACGSIAIDKEAIVRESAPIYKRFLGLALDTLLLRLTDNGTLIEIIPLKER